LSEVSRLRAAERKVPTVVNDFTQSPRIRAKRREC